MLLQCYSILNWMYSRSHTSLLHVLSCKNSKLKKKKTPKQQNKTKNKTKKSCAKDPKSLIYIYMLLFALIFSCISDYLLSLYHICESTRWIKYTNSGWAEFCERPILVTISTTPALNVKPTHHICIGNGLNCHGIKCTIFAIHWPSLTQ